MKQLILTFTLIFASLLPCAAQDSVENPVFLGSILVDQISVDKMVDICKWYKFVEVPSADDGHAFKADDGTIITFSMSSDNALPYIEIQTTNSKKSIDKTLIQAGYHKANDRYEKGSHYATTYNTCRVLGNKHKRVIFTKVEGSI